MPHDRNHPTDLFTVDYSALTMEQRDAFRREAVLRAEAARAEFWRTVFTGLAHIVGIAFNRLTGRKRGRPVRIPGRTITQGLARHISRP